MPPPTATARSLDRVWLGSWIAPRHLEPEAIARCRAAYETHPARLLAIDDFLREEVAEDVGRFLREEAVYETAYGLYSAEDHEVDEATWRAAPERDRFLRFDKLSGVRPESRLGSSVLRWLRLRAAILDPRFRPLLERWTGLALGTCTRPHANAFRQGHYLRPHDDDERDRRLALVFHFSAGWRPEYGGAFEIACKNGWRQTIDARWNSFVLFDVRAGTRHRVAPLAPAAGDRARLSVGCWVHDAGR